MKIKDILENCEKQEGEVSSFINVIRKCFNFESKLNTGYYGNIENSKFKVFDLYKYMTDERRGIWLKVAYFNEQLIAFWYLAGREGDDNYNGFILDKENFINGINYLEELYNEEDLIEFSIEDDIEELNFIYGFDMSKKIMNVNLDLKYEKDEIVNVSLKEDKHIFPEIIQETIRCQVLSVDKKSLFCCYTLKILDYKNICCFGNKNRKKRLFLKTDVLNYTEVFDTKIPFNELSLEQKNTIIEYLNKDSHGIINLSFKEEYKINK